MASTGKDLETGRLTTHEYRVEGPAAILLTTTAAEVDEELLNRCLVLGVDPRPAPPPPCPPPRPGHAPATPCAPQGV